MSTDPELERLPDKLYFRIGEVAAVVGVEPHVLRYWESEFNLKPLRSKKGQRLYRKQDIARFLKIRHLLHEQGFTVAGARRLLRERDQLEQQVPPGVSPDAIREALSRIEALRGRIAELREELEGLD